MGLENRFALQILKDLDLLRRPPWPVGKVKRLAGGEYWEMKSGDFRTIFWPHQKDVVVLRVVDRRDLEKAIGRIDVRAVRAWLERAPK